MSKGLPTPTLAKLERALDIAVSALVAFRRDPPEQVRRAMGPPAATFEVLTAADLLETDHATLAARDVATAPIDEGLKYSIRQIGKLIHKEVGDDGMLDVAERVCGLDDAQWQRRMSPIDSAWDGIGSWHS